MADEEKGQKGKREKGSGEKTQGEKGGRKARAQEAAAAEQAAAAAEEAASPPEEKLPARMRQRFEQEIVLHARKRIDCVEAVPDERGDNSFGRRHGRGPRMGRFLPSLGHSHSP